jgi:flagellar biosynthesis protein FlhB
MFLLLVINVSLVSAQEVTTVGDITKSIGKWLADAFGYTDVRASQDWRFMAILLVIFFMLFFAFSDIISNFTAFSKTTSYILGFGLAVIAALTKGVLFLAHYVFGITAALGTISVAIVIITAFVAVVLLHLGLEKFEPWLSRRKRYIEAAKETAKVKKGMQLLYELGKK